MSESAAERHGRIVVGVDDSEGSAHALRWAARQAGFFTGATLEAVIAGQYPAFFGGARPGETAPTSPGSPTRPSATR